MNEQLAHKGTILPRVRRVVIKVGSTILSDQRGIDEARLTRLVAEICALRSHFQVVLVSSGAVAVGMARLGLRERPKTVPQRQATAAVGQIGLMALYEERFAEHRQQVAQVLLTHEDLANRRRYINARHTFEELLKAEVVPVVNENDTVAVEEVMFNFGDNDNLSALVATLIGADLLVILSDVEGLYTTNPTDSADARLVPLVERLTAEIHAFAQDGATTVGTGGMASKLRAAEKAARAGIPSIVADGVRAGVLEKIFDPEQSEGTLFLAQGDRMSRRKHWIAHTLRPAGSVILDAGACGALRHHGRSLLAKGIGAVNGHFEAGDCVSCCEPDGREFARGLVNYSSADIEKIKGLHTNAIEGVLGYKFGNEVIHRDDLALVD
jgi:glutamate 5-kinase